jgi:hypothetical protein
MPRTVTGLAKMLPRIPDPYDDMLAALHKGTLPAAGFSHRHHIGVAVAALRRYTFFQALWVVADGLQRLTVRAGVPEKFNATITLASMSLIAEYLEKNPKISADQLMDEHPEILSLRQIKSLYAPDRLVSDIARRTGLLPMTISGPPLLPPEERPDGTSKHIRP